MAIMLVVIFMVGACLTCSSWAESNLGFIIGGKSYEADCNLTRTDLIKCDPNCQSIEETCAIRSIPYAKASRFRKAQPLSPEERKLLKWTNKPVHCAQLNPFGDGVVGNEDCLVIDLYFDPKTMSTAQGLIVVLEGLDFENSIAGFLKPSHGSGALSYKIAVVHYRTGPLGFLTLGNDHAPANLGLWDQQMALMFLQNEVKNLYAKEQFIFLGYGSGAVALHLHMMNPISSMIVRKAYLSAGNALSPGTTSLNPVNATSTLAKRLQCKTEPDEAMIECLRAASFENLLEKANADPPLRFATVFDSRHSNARVKSKGMKRCNKEAQNSEKCDEESQTAFLTATIEDSILKHNVTRITCVIHGYPAYAGSFHFVRNKNHGSPAGDNTTYLQNFFTFYGKTASESMASLVSDHYYKKGAQALAPDSSELINILTDYLVGGPAQWLILDHLRKKEATEGKMTITSYLMRPEGSGEKPVTLASHLGVAKKDETIELPYGSILDDLLLFIGCEGINIFDAGPGHPNLKPVIQKESKAFSLNVLQCLLDSSCSEVTHRDLTYENQIESGKIRLNAYRYEHNVFWTPVRVMASTLGAIEARMSLLLEKDANLISTSDSRTALLVVLIVMVVISVILICVSTKLLLDKRRAPPSNAIAKPPRSSASDNAEVEGVTTEEAKST